MMTDRSALLNAPPRISDLHGEERMRALAERKRRHDENWRRDRRKVPLLARLFAPHLKDQAND